MPRLLKLRGSNSNMADKKTVETQPTENADALDKARGFWENYSRIIIYVGVAIIVLIGGWFAYQNLVVAPKEEQAAELIFPAENLFDKMATAGFSKDSVNIVLNGGDLEGKKITGLLKIISQSGGTPAGNRAKYLAGASYLHINEYAKAIKYLEDFDGNGASQVESNAYMMLGHANAELDKKEAALKNYKKAASVNDKDEFFASNALLVAASYADAIGNSKEAINLYQQVKKNYPMSTAVQNGEVDKNLAKLGILE